MYRNENEDKNDGERTTTGDNLPLNAFGAICVGISRPEEVDLPPRLEIEHRL